MFEQPTIARTTDDRAASYIRRRIAPARASTLVDSRETKVVTTHVTVATPCVNSLGICANGVQSIGGVRSLLQSRGRARDHAKKNPCFRNFLVLNDAKFVTVTIQTNHGLIFTVAVPQANQVRERSAKQPLIARRPASTQSRAEGARQRVGYN